MPVAIDRWICVAICRSNNASSTISSLNYNKKAIISPHVPDKFQEIWKQLTATTINQLKTEFNINEGIKTVQPSAVDVNSGVESEPGIKDKVKMKKLFDTIENSNHIAKKNRYVFDGNL